MIVEHAFWMKKEGYKPSTIERRAKILKVISRQADRKDAEAVKTAIAEMDWSEGTKELACDAYVLLARSLGFTFEKPRYERIEKLPFIPLESEIDALISGTGPKTSAVLQLLKETGARIGEAWTLKWTDIDFERGIVTLAPEKGSHPRQFKISLRTCSAVNMLPKRNTRIFATCDVEKLLFRPGEGPDLFKVVTSVAGNELHARIIQIQCSRKDWPRRSCSFFRSRQ